MTRQCWFKAGVNVPLFGRDTKLVDPSCVLEGIGFGTLNGLLETP